MRERRRHESRSGVLNAVQKVLERHRAELGLERFGLSSEMTFLFITPRFRASRHVVVLVLPRGAPDPTLAAKLPRLPGDDGGLRREASALQAARAARPQGFGATIPRLVVFEPEEAHSVLVETALRGRGLGRPDIRRSRQLCIRAVEAWLKNLDESRSGDMAGPEDYRRLLGDPLRRFAGAFPEGSSERSLVERTLELASPLSEGVVPLVFEHGDLSEPNLILLGDGRVGVVDWELAEPRGLPGHDLTFFLAYAAFAASGTTTAERQAGTFAEAFMSPDGWARASLRAYACRLELPEELLPALVVACWARQTAALLARTGSETPSSELADWLRANRYHALWRESLNRAAEL